MFGLRLQRVDIPCGLDDDGIAHSWLLQVAVLQSMALFGSEAMAVVQVDRGVS